MQTNESARLLFETLCLLLREEGQHIKTMAGEASRWYLENIANNPMFKNPVADLYRDIIRSILDEGINPQDSSEIDALMLRYKDHPVCREDEELYIQLANVMKNPESITQRRATNMTKRVRNKILAHRHRTIIRKLFALNHRFDQVETPEEQSQLLHEVLSNASDLTAAYSQTYCTSDADIPVDEIDFSKKDSLKKALVAHKSKTSDRVWKTGLQGLNRMLAPEHGFLGGEFIVFGALPHDFKSGMLMQIVRWIAMHNNPGPVNGKIPVIVCISLENEVFQNMMEWFKTIYIHTFHKEPVGMDDDEIIDMCINAFNSRGFQLRVYRRMGSDFGYNEFVQLIEGLRADDFAPVAAVIDYMTLMKPEVGGGNDATNMQMLYRRMRDYGNHNNLTIATAAQLNKYAADMAQNGMSHVVTKFHSGLFSDCTAIGKEADTIFFLHIEKSNRKIDYLTIAWAKRRYHRPPHRKMCAYPFNGALGILDDINGKCKAVYDIYTDDTPIEGVVDDELADEEGAPVEVSMAAF